MMDCPRGLDGVSVRAQEHNQPSTYRAMLSRDETSHDHEHGVGTIRCQHASLGAAVVGVGVSADERCQPYMKRQDSHSRRGRS